MSQEYTEDKDVSLQPLSSGRRLLEALLILVALFAIYLMVSLVSFNPSDPSWSQTAWHEPIHNLGGSIGAWLADTLLFIFGVMAYAIPPVILGLCWITFRQRDSQDYIDYFAVGLRLIGVLALVITTCGLAALNADDIWYFASGGVIGSLVSNAMAPWFSGAGGTLTLLCVWAAGITLYTGWSWLTIAEKIGAAVMGVLTFASNRSRHDEPWDEEDDEDIVDASPVREASARMRDADDVLLAAPRAGHHNGAESSTEDDPLLAPPVVSGPSETAARSQAATAASAASPAVTSAASATSSAAPGTSAAVPAGSSVPPAPPVMAAAITPAFRASDAERQPPRYRFELPEETPVIPAQTTRPEEEEGPRMGNWHDATRAAETPGGMTSAAATTAAVATATQASSGAVPFMPAFSAAPEGDYNPQVKQGIGPALPRPNPVKIPTRRELASFGIKLPSQRIAEEKAKEAEPALTATPAQSAEPPGVEDADLHEAQLRDAFQAQQKQRYGESWQQEEEDEEAQHQAALARQFAEQQQQRYTPQESSQDEGPGFSLDPAAAFDFSPMKDLVDEGPAEPLFTIAATPAVEPEPSQESHWQQPAEPQLSPTPLNTSGAASYPQPETVQSLSQPQPVSQAPAPEPAVQESLIHPFLMRHEQPLQKPTTPLPTLDLLTPPPAEEEPVDMFALEQTARLVEARLADYRVKAEVVGISPGPVITRFELDLAPGVKASRISNLSRDLARSLSAVAVRVVEVIPGKPYVGLELPNKRRQTVYLREVLDCPSFRDNPSPLAVVLGKDIAGQPVVADLAKMPHLLVAGTTGSGKSVGVNTMIISMLYKATPEEVRFIMIDPKMLELSVYEGIPHLLTEVVTDMKDAANALRWSVGEMERRYKLMSALGVRNLAGYNEKVEQAEAMGRPIPDPFWKPGDSMDMTPPVLEKLPYIVVLVDEFADLMMAVGKKVEELIARLAQKARAAGIHLVLATQRPSVDVITGLIKANIPTRIAFTVSSKIDSRTILDQGGAESLLGMGDMLYMPPNSSMPVRVHGAFVRDQEVHAVVSDWKARGRPQYIDSITAGEESEGGSLGLEGGEELDPLFDQAVAFVVEKRRASISGVQRQFRIGYNRAARIIEQMEAQGIVSEPGHNGNREVLSPPPHEM